MNRTFFGFKWEVYAENFHPDFFFVSSQNFPLQMSGRWWAEFFILSRFVSLLIISLFLFVCLSLSVYLCLSLCLSMSLSLSLLFSRWEWPKSILLSNFICFMSFPSQSEFLLYFFLSYLILSLHKSFLIFYSFIFSFLSLFLSPSFSHFLILSQNLILKRPPNKSTPHYIKTQIVSSIFPGPLMAWLNHEVLKQMPRVTFVAKDYNFQPFSLKSPISYRKKLSKIS